MNKVMLATGLALVLAFTLSCSLSEKGGISGPVVGEGGESGGDASLSVDVKTSEERGGKLPDEVIVDPVVNNGEPGEKPPCVPGPLVQCAPSGGDYVKPDYVKPEERPIDSSYVQPAISLSGAWVKPPFTLVVDESNGTFEVSSSDDSFSVTGVIALDGSYHGKGSFGSDKAPFEFKLGLGFLYILNESGEFGALGGQWTKGL